MPHVFTNRKYSMVTERQFEPHFLMESVAFGLTDGIICFLGIIVGVATATLDSKFVLIAGIVGGVADALGNSIGFFVSQATERAVQMREAKAGDNAHIHSKREVTMSGVFSFLATLIALLFLLFPFPFLQVWEATTVSFVVGTVLAFVLGIYIGKLSGENIYRSGIKYTAITILGAVISYGIGILLHIII
jgi:predicted membrane protein (TIGR00267 family)